LCELTSHCQGRRRWASGYGSGLLREEILAPDLDDEEAHPAGPKAGLSTSCPWGEPPPDGLDLYPTAAAKLIIGRNIY
jgi:hypothetical protein